MKRIIVEQLFGHLNYDIDLGHSDIIIITGPNGYGKTMLLTIINNILNNNLNDLILLRFHAIKIWLNDNIFVEIIKSNNQVELKINSEHNESIYSEQTDIHHFNSKPSVGTKNKLVLSDLLSLTSNKTELKIPEHIYNEFLYKYRSTFIKTQRIQQDSQHEPSITKHADRLAKLIADVSEEASKISQELDSTFPFRLSEKFNSRVSSQRTSNARDRLLGIESLKKNYINYNLIEIDKHARTAEHISSEAIREYSELWDLYIEDSLTKLAPFAELYKKIHLFVTLIEDKLFAFKNIKIDKERGFYFLSSVFKDRIVPLNKLSSGEQNQVILYFDMIFNSSADSVILIDEPEISLHLGWQKEFLHSVLDIAKLTNPAKIIIATHSPNIIDNNWNICRDLFTLSENFNREI